MCRDTRTISPILAIRNLSILDSSCGDMNWMPRFLDTRTDVVFTGYDITVSNIDSHKAKFADKPWSFKVQYHLHKNIVHCKMPEDGLINPKYCFILSQNWTSRTAQFSYSMLINICWL